RVGRGYVVEALDVRERLDVELLQNANLLRCQPDSLECIDGRVVVEIRHGPEERGHVDVRRDHRRGAPIETRKVRAVPNATLPVRFPLQPANARKERHISRWLLEKRQAVVGPWAGRTLRTSNRLNEQLHPWVDLMPQRHSDDVETKVELEVVPLHR